MSSAALFGGNGYGTPWGQNVGYTNINRCHPNSGNGNDWLPIEWPTIILDFDDSTTGGPAQTVRTVDSDGTTTPFMLEGDAYVPGFGEKTQITFQGETYLQSNPDGSTVTYSAGTGMFLSQADAAGNSIDVVAWTSGGSNISTVQRSVTTEAGTVKDRYLYDYDDPSSTSPLLQTVTLQRQVGNGPWENISQASYTYYEDGEEHGSAGDLKTSASLLWSGSEWENTGTSYFRYYATDSSSSSLSSGDDTDESHLLKFSLNAAAYDRMVTDGYDPTTVSDSVLGLYADNYFEYDSERRVTKSVLKSGSQTFLFEYELSGLSDGYNRWATRTTETLPDGNQNIVYTNYAGQEMLKVFKAGENQWLDFTSYDDNANAILQANPSAITGYDDTYPDLLNFDPGSGTYQYLRDDEGLITTNTYHEPSGYVDSNSLQEGQLGTSLLLSSMTYCQCGGNCDCGNSSSSSSSSSSTSGGRGGNVWFLATSTQYPSDTDPAKTIVTSHCYSFFPGTCAVQQHVTTLPVIPIEQNGSGVANSSREYFDSYGNLTWKMDERGFITRMAYDIPTGAMTQQVQDVDTSLYGNVPAGWVTPSGGGLNLITDFQHDDQGRTTQSLGPSHSIDLSGSATEIRTASWTVYDDASHVAYSGQGYATGCGPTYTYTLVNPVSITKMDASGRVNEQIQAVAPSTSGTLAAIIAGAGGGEAAFPQPSYTRWTTNQYTDCCLAASHRVYHTIPATGAGLPGTNYDQTDYGYDVMKRRNRTVSPGGTITDVVYEPRGFVIGTYIGTNDDGATETDPTGGGTDPHNNMVIVTGNEYDDGLDGGDGNVTELTQYVDSTTTRVTLMTYDFRNRTTTTDGEVDYFAKVYYDNLNRTIKSERYNTTLMGNLIARSETKFDNQGRVYQSIRYGVDPSTGTVGNSLVDNSWFDESGNVIKSLPAGSNLFTKTEYDSLGRTAVQYRGYNLTETGYPR